MKFCVVVKVSRRTVTFWYQTEGKRYCPLAMREGNTVPLYFCVDNSGFSFGNNARERFYAHDPNAYGQYFDLIGDPSRHFALHGSPKRIKQLLYYGVEQYLSHFLNTVLYDNNSIESHRSEFPLKFIFEPDLGAPERRLVKSLFTEAGYRNVLILNYHDILLEHLRAAGAAGTGQSVLYLTGLDDILYLELYVKDSKTPTAVVSLPGQGSDPRIRILAEMVVEYIAAQNHYLNLDAAVEAAALLPFCAELLSTSGPILSGEAELTKGRKFWFSIKLKRVEDRLQYFTGDVIISASITDLLQNHGIRPEQVLILLGSDEIRTPYFSGRILKGYPHIRGIESAHSEAAMHLIFDRAVPVLDAQNDVHFGVDRQPVPPKPPLPPVRPSAPPLPAATKPPETKSAVKPPLPEIKPSAAGRPGNMVPPPLPPKKS